MIHGIEHIHFYAVPFRDRPIKRLAFLAAAFSALVLTQASAQLLTQRILPATLALEAAQSAMEACIAAGYPEVAIAIVDSRGTEKLMLAGDPSPPSGTAGAAISRAQIALQPYPNYRNIPLKGSGSYRPEVRDKLAAPPIIGSFPIMVEDDIIGAIGVAGGEADTECAKAGWIRIRDRMK